MTSDTEDDDIEYDDQWGETLAEEAARVRSVCCNATVVSSFSAWTCYACEKCDKACEVKEVEEG